ncbi:MOSC N-terminal beta barrel domain-containing protein [Ekhidna sp.]|uniref:MOSC domain-containing protein n=1 Tax=Ekhidna sp. TaxID=2608089 RepID=UPI0032972537
MKVSGLYIYPIKSFQGISLREVEVLERGFRYDRRWMLVNHRNILITQRSHTQISQVGIRLTSDSIIASYSGLPDLEIPLTLKSNTHINVTVWNDQVQALEAPSEINEWFSKIATESCKLVFMPETASRPINPERAINGENVSFADGYPYLILGQSSLDDLNSRLDASVPMNRFRPNIVVEGSKAYEEDNWNDIQIGDVKFHVTHPCKRCVFTTIDQETGAKGAEPLKTLATYRREGKEVIFGVNTLAFSTGKIKITDTIQLNS